MEKEGQTFLEGKKKVEKKLWNCGFVVKRSSRSLLYVVKVENGKQIQKQNK